MIEVGLEAQEVIRTRPIYGAPTFVSDPNLPVYTNVQGTETKPGGLIWSQRHGHLTLINKRFLQGATFYGFDRLTLINCVFHTRETNGVGFEHPCRMVGCRNVTAIDCNTVGRQVFDVGEQSYGVAADYCDDMLFLRWNAFGCHRAGVLSTCNRVVVDQSICNRGDGHWDIHGLGGSQMTFRRLRGDTDFYAGNRSWPVAGSQILVEDSELPRFKVIGRATGVVFRRCVGTATNTLQQLTSITDELFEPVNVRYEDCQLQRLSFEHEEHNGTTWVPITCTIDSDNQIVFAGSTTGTGGNSIDIVPAGFGPIIETEV